MNEQTVEEKMFLFFQAIEEIKTGNDGSITIEWKNNVVQKIPGNDFKIVDGLEVTKAEEIHLNPETDLDENDIHNIKEVIWKK